MFSYLSYNKGVIDELDNLCSYIRAYLKRFPCVWSRSGLVVFLSAVVLLSPSCRHKGNDVALSKELGHLDEMVKKAPEFDKRRQNHIDQLKGRLVKAGQTPTLQRWSLYKELGDNFKGFSSDSAVIYYTYARDEAAALGNDSLRTLSRIERVNALSAAGIFSAAQSELAAIDTVGLSSDLKVNYALAGRQLYSYLTSYISGYEHIYPELQNRLGSFTDYVLSEMNPADPMRQVLGYEQLVSSGRYNEAQPKLEALLQTLPQNSNLYGRAAYQLALVYHAKGDENAYARALALAAESDLQASVKEGMALPMLAEWLYENGDTHRAFNYINLSMKDAAVGNARMRTDMIANAITLIDAAYKDQEEQSRWMLTIFLIVAVGLLILSGELLQLSGRRKRKMIDDQQKLSRLTRLQDSYIGHFIALCANYSDKLTSMSRLVDRKISSGQTDDLIKMIKSGKFTDEHIDDFYTHFDNVFLDLYPHFVDDVNALLREEEKLSLHEDGSMPAELRIYALVRLGINESVKISKILRYSPATIYTYRNKMRNRAINRETFDDDVVLTGV